MVFWPDGMLLVFLIELRTAVVGGWGMRGFWPTV